MKVFDRCQELNLPPTEFIVVGSGVLDPLGIRESRDLDIVVEQPTFEKLERHGFIQKTKDEDPYLERGEIEVWLTFDGKSFAELVAKAVQIKGYNFTSLELVKNWKLKRGLEKDKRDLQLIQKYLSKNT